MDFNELVQIEVDSCYNMTHEDARKIVAGQLLEGFRDLNDAKEWANDFAGREVCLYTAMGYPANSEALLEAIAVVESETQAKIDQYLDSVFPLGTGKGD